MNRLIDRLRTYIPTREKILQNRWLAYLHPFLAHPRLWHWSRRGVALGVALGVFFGLLIPIAQIPISAAAAILLRANIPAAAASTLVTNPITFGPVYYAAYHLGNRFYDQPDGAEQPKIPGQNEPGTGSWEQVRKHGLPLITGLAILASILGLASYAIISLVWYWRVKTKRRRGIKNYQTKREQNPNAEP